ncbi:MAG: nitroreductase family protein [Anaerolineales bacterium]|nr:nitroreductase family protein [Anaerolineales bacterium]
MDLATVDKLLTTTRTVRKRLDLEKSVPRSIIEECLQIAVQAPTGSNAQGWHFLVITDAEKRARIGELYKQSFTIYARSGQEQPERHGTGDELESQMGRVVKSAVYLANNMHRVPVMIIPCIAGRAEKADQMTQAGLYGSILPATWSLMLALRARGLGAAWTTLHLRFETEIANLLDIPRHITQAALLPVAYYTGDDFKPARRKKKKKITSWETWSG